MTGSAAWAGALLAALCGRAAAQSEGDYFTVEHFPSPEGARLEVGGLAFLPDARLLVSTRRGQVWRLENPAVADVTEARWSLFAEGLQEGLGLAVVAGEVYVVQRGELSRLADEDGDGTCDRIDTLANGWGLSGNYHEFAFGLPRDREGNFVVTLNVAFFSPKWWHGKSPVPYRGWALKVAPDGAVTPFAYGFRSPCGVGTNAAGDLFVTDNQGDWVASSPIYHLVEGGFYGHPASLEWTAEYQATGTKASDEVPPPAAERRRPAAIWIPYEWSRSTGNLVSAPADGAFGPWDPEQLFVAELTNGMVLRAGLERIQGEYQGWILPFRQEIGSVCRVAFAPDGTLFCGLTNRGWGGKPPNDGLARLRPTGRTPLEIAGVALREDGFELRFTQELAALPAAEDVRVEQYDYDYWWEYGSPERHRRTLAVSAIEPADDRRGFVARVAGLGPAAVARLGLPELVSTAGEPLLHREVAYTVNQLPGRGPTPEHVCKVVPPPPSKESDQEGWLMLTWGDALGLWRHEGWSLADAVLPRPDAPRFELSPGTGALVNDGAAPSDLVSRPEFGDVELHLGFMLPRGGASGVRLLDRYEVRLVDSARDHEPGVGDCGAIPATAEQAGRSPAFQAFRGPGEWHDLDLVFRAPRFDDQGRRTREARFERILIDGLAVHENVRLESPTVGAPERDEVARGPLVLRGDAGLVAFRDVRVKPGGRRERGEGWTEVFPPEGFEEWPMDGEAEWTLEDEVISGSGRMGHLFSPRGDYGDFELSSRVKISDGGNSGLYFRAQPTGGWPLGYEAQVNSSFPDPQKTGSLYGLLPVATELVPPDTWFDYGILCEDVSGGTHVVITVNGATVVDVVDERRHAPGHIALQQHHEGSAVCFRDVRIRER